MNFLYKILSGVLFMHLCIGTMLTAQSLPPVCAGDKQVGYRVPKGAFESIYVWEIEGENENEVSVVRMGDSIFIDWLSERTDYYSLKVTEYYVYFKNGNHNDTAIKCEGLPFYDSVLVRGPTDITIGRDQEICYGDQIVFQSNRSYEEYLWSNGATDSVSYFQEQGNVWIEVTDNNNCSWRDTAYLTVHSLPIVELGPDISLCDEDEYILDVETEGIFYDEYIWYGGQGMNTELIEFYNQTEISLTEQIQDQNNTDSIRVLVKDKYPGYYVTQDSMLVCMNGDTVTISPCKKVLGEIPTVITPNGDGFNDVFKIERMEKYPQNYTEAVVLIYDRWGKLVFESEPGYPEPWDGKDLRGKNLPMDSYFYVIDLRNQSKPVTGHITIVR